ncbi:MAG: sulfite exporter TauE/SafE family protein [Paracoccaceae bacterium]
MDLSTLQYLFIGLAALLIGISKTSVEVGILAVLLVAIALPGKASPGVVLPMLIAADIMAVMYYRQSCQWHILWRLFPAAFVGVVLGFGILWVVPDLNFERIIGWIIAAMLAVDLGLNEAARKRFKGPVITAIVGSLGGAASMIANAAGPVFGVYFLQMGLKKIEFVGTRAWLFLVMNVAKLPFAFGLGLVTPQTLGLNLAFLPVILLGAGLGIWLLRVINIRMFTGLIRVGVMVAATRLILG